MKTDTGNLLILRELRQNFSNFSKLDKYSTKTFKGHKIIRFETFLEVNDYGQQYTHIFFHKTASIEETCNYIKERHNDLLSLKNSIVYLVRNKRKTEQSKNRINELLTPLKVEYIEDLIKQLSINKFNLEFDKEPFTVPDAFIFPNIAFENMVINGYTEKQGILYDDFDIFQKEVLDNWFESEETPILLIKGEGGIGKTTIAQYFSNYFLKRNNNTSKFFIDSFEAKKRLVRDYKNHTNIDLYDLYNASSGSKNTLDDLFFKYNLDAGNLFLIIDGIDELISKVENFDINRFLNSIHEFNSEINNTKVIITCRTYFWNVENFDEKAFKILEISAFDEIQTKKFFSKSFKNNDKKVEKAFEYAIDFHKNSIEENSFHPYALDIITRIIDDEVLLKDKPNTTLLNSKLILDYIVLRICNREKYLEGGIRVLNLTIDEQIETFNEIAVKYNGEIPLDYLKNCIETTLRKEVPGNLIEAYKTHPLVSINHKFLKFKYDFLVDFFKSIYIATFINYNSEAHKITDEFLMLLENCWFGSSISKDVANRIETWADGEFMKVSEFLGQIDNGDYPNKQILYSGIFNLIMAINKVKKGINKIENTRLIKEIYGENTIKNLCIENVYSKDFKVTFDFTNITLINCYFDNYNDFWSCSFNESTKFYNCTFHKLGQKLGKDSILITIKDNVGKDCIYDDTFSKTFDDVGKTSEEYKKKIDKFINSFFHFFYFSGYFQPQDFEEPSNYVPFSRKYADFGDLNIPMDKFIELANKIGIIEWPSKYNNRKLNISGEHRSEIKKMITEGTPSKKAEEFKDELYNIIRN